MQQRLTLRGAALAVLVLAAPALGQRATGIDVSAWQGTITWPTVAKPVSQGGGGVQFAFIRSSRGGTTGTYNQSTRVGTLSHRYDDPFFVSNIDNATANGILAGPYHFARPDLVLGLVDMNGFQSTATSTAIDEADHFLQQAGTYMRPGYIRPVFDLEGGSTQRTRAELTTYGIAFSDRIFAVTGVRPIVYINSSYANDEVDSRLNTHDLWLARYIDPATVNVQTSEPPAASGWPNVYGVWNPTYPTMPAVKPWDFWQYTSKGRVPGIGGGTSNVDLNVANGNIEYVRDFLVPAIWKVDANGQWTTPANWNGVIKTPQPIDRVIVDRSAGNYTLTLSSGAHSVRSLQMNETFRITGGSLNVAQYANLANATFVASGSLTAATIANTGELSHSGGSITATAVTGTGTLAVSGGTLRAGTITQSLLSVASGSATLTSTGTSVVTSLTLGGTGTLDIANAKLVVDHASTSDPLTSIREALLARRLITATPGVSVGYARSTDLFTSFPATFGGKAVDASAVLLMLALPGDLDLNGTVNFADLVALAASYNGNGAWRQGDVNYDGLINFSDLVLLAQNYNVSRASEVSVDGASASFQSDWALAQTLVPEPTIATALLALCPRRRRR